MQIFDCTEEKLQCADAITASLVGMLWGIDLFTLKLLVE
jgi:hypothetical protein